MYKKHSMSYKQNEHNINNTYKLSYIYKVFTQGFICLSLVFALISSPISVFATELNTVSPIYTNSETTYNIYINDDADLLSSSEEQTLLTNIEQITKYGNVAFVSISENPYNDTEYYAKNYATKYFGSESGIIFLFDMDERYIWIHSTGTIYKIVTTAYADTITDNVYRYASNGDYFQCVDMAFSQIHSLLEGYKIAQPMKYISNLLLSLILAMLFNYILVMTTSKAKKAKNKQILDNIYTSVAVTNPSVKFLHQTKTYHPPSTEKGSSSGGSKPSGGGSHGGGGGHKF